jgi:hypothetical protein
MNNMLARRKKKSKKRPGARPGKVNKSSDLDSVHERLAPFVAAGFRALCAAAGARHVAER